MALKDDLQASLEQAVFEPGPKCENVVNFGQERLARRPEALMAKDVTPDELIPFVHNEIKTMGNVSKCYLTLVTEEADSFHVINYRAGMTRHEEIAYRLLGVLEAIDNWREDR